MGPFPHLLTPRCCIGLAIKLLLNKEKCAKNLAWVLLPYCAHHKQEILLYLIIYVCLAINMIVEQCIESFVSLISRALNTLYITGCPPNDRAFPFSVQETVLERQGRGRKTVEQLYEAFIVLMDKIQGR